MAKKIGNTFFYLAIVLETLFVLLDRSAYIIQHETWWFRLTFLMFCVKIAYTKYSKREWMCMAFFVLLGIVSWYNTDREEIIRMVALVAACKGMDRKRIMKIVLFETFVGTVIIMALAFAGILGKVSITGMFRGGGVLITRYCFGMGHPNAFHCMVMMIMLLILVIYNERMTWFAYVSLAIVNVIVFYFTDSRTGVLITMAMIVFAATLHYGSRVIYKKSIFVLAEIFLSACVIFSIYIAKVGVKSDFFWNLDSKLNGRIQWASMDGGMQYWSLFSNVNNRNFVDMSYVRLFYWYGIIPTVICLILLAVVIWKCRELKANDAFLVLMTFVAYSLFEAHAVSVYIGRNYSLFCIGTMLPMIINGTQQTEIKEYSLFDIGKVSTRKWSKITK